MNKITDDTARCHGWRSIRQWRRHWAERLGIVTERKLKLLTPAMLRQLECCADDAARSILLGITTTGEERKAAKRPIRYDNIVVEERQRMRQ